MAASALRECCGTLVAAAAAAEEGGWGGMSELLEDAKIVFLRCVSAVLSSQLPRLEQQQQVAATTAGAAGAGTTQLAGMQP